MIQFRSLRAVCKSRLAVITMLPPLAVLQIFFAKGSGTNPVGNPRWGTGGYVFAPRHGPLVWHSALKTAR